VLLIGDSISCGYGPKVITNLEGKVYVDRMANSRGVQDPILFKEIRMAIDDYAYKVIHFNNGLHAMHLSEKEYGKGLEKYVRMIEDHAQGARLIWASSTPIRKTSEGYPLDEKMNGIVLQRNVAAAKIMAEHQIPIDDLYSVVVDKPEFSAGDGYHYKEDGYKVLGKVVADKIDEIEKKEC
jgi:lysophospholipase L1-like esterase